MIRVTFIKKTEFDLLPSAVKNEITNLSDLLSSIPVATLDSVDYYVISFRNEIYNSKFAVYFKMYTESEALKIIQSGTIDYEEVDIYYDNKGDAFRSNRVSGGGTLLGRYHGSSVANVLTLSSGSVRFSAPYQQARIHAIEVIGGDSDGKVDFSILDDGSGTYTGTPDLVIRQFVFDVNVSSCLHRGEAKYVVDLYLGMVIKMEYYNNGASTRNVSFNAELSEVI